MIIKLKQLFNYKCLFSHLQVVTACSVLHNICLGVGDIVAPDDETEEDNDDDVVEDDLQAVSGGPRRDRISAEVSALVEAPVDHNYC